MRRCVVRVVNRASDPAAARFGERPIHGSKQACAFLGVIHREPLPILAMTQIGKKTSGILVKVQERPAFGVENPELFLDENAAPSQDLDHIAKSREGSCVGVFHWEAL
jgi:hypothetical protein